jgi:hypothetical protein
VHGVRIVASPASPGEKPSGSEAAAQPCHEETRDLLLLL